MTTQDIFIVLNVIIIAALMLSIIYTAGVVWRVEKELDISYKFFLTAIIFLFSAEILDLYYAFDSAIKIALAVKILRALFTIFFLIGVFLMRDIVRRLDGEKKSQ